MFWCFLLVISMLTLSGKLVLVYIRLSTNQILPVAFVSTEAPERFEDLSHPPPAHTTAPFDRYSAYQPIRYGMLLSWSVEDVNQFR